VGGSSACTDNCTLTGTTNLTNVVVEGSLDLGTFELFTVNDATPSVSGGTLFKTSIGHGGAVQITAFDGGAIGQRIYVWDQSTANITFDCDSTFLDCGPTDVVTEIGDITIWISTSSGSFRLERFLNLDADQSSEKAPLASPVFTGDPTAPTPPAADNDTSIATTAFVQSETNQLGSELQSTTNDITTSSTNDEVRFIGNAGGEIFTLDLGHSNDVRFHSSTGITRAHFQGINFFTTGDFQGNRPVKVRTGTTDTIGTAVMGGNKYYYSNAGTVTVTVAAIPVAGAFFCINDIGATGIITIDVDASDVINLPSGPLAAGNTIDSSGAFGERVCFEAWDTTNWLVTDVVGTWVDGGAS